MSNSMYPYRKVSIDPHFMMSQSNADVVEEVSYTEVSYESSTNDGFSDSSMSLAGHSQGGSSSKDARFARVNRVKLDKNSDEYRKRRERNNQAVKKSRNKTKEKTQQTLERVNQLRKENEALEIKNKILAKELAFLKTLFLNASGAIGQQGEPAVNPSENASTGNSQGNQLQVNGN